MIMNETDAETTERHGRTMATTSPTTPTHLLRTRSARCRRGPSRAERGSPAEQPESAEEEERVMPRTTVPLGLQPRRQAVAANEARPFLAHEEEGTSWHG